MIKWSCIVLFIFVVVWALGLHTSLHQSERIAVEFYEWLHEEGFQDEHSYMETVPETAPSLLKRFAGADEPFKKHLQMQGMGDVLDKPILPRPFHVVKYGSASNGSSCFSGYFPFGSAYVATIRTEKAKDEETYGSIVVVIQTSLFGR